MKHWWLTEGVIVEFEGELFYYISTLALIDDAELIPRGVPFDCMPEWARFIDFSDDGWFYYYSGDKVGEAFPFHHCPDEWKGKTFTITDELRELLKR